MKVSLFFKYLFGFLIIGILLSSCLAHVHDLTPSPGGEPAGFIKGLWHGVIAPFTFIFSLFSDHIAVYEVYNNGGWYDFGFLLGIGAFTKGSSAGAKKMKKK